MVNGVHESPRTPRLTSSPRDAQFISPSKSGTSLNGPAVVNSFPAFDVNHKDDHSLSVRSRVERLSICENADTKKEILNKLSAPVDVSVNDEDEVTDMNDMAGSKRRRRRSSAVQTSSLDNLKQSNSSSSSISVPKKKKKSSKAAVLTIDPLTKALSIKDLRDLILFAFHDTNNSPKWVQIENRSSLQKIVVLFTPGLLPKDFGFQSKDGCAFSDNLEKLKNSSSLPSSLFSISDVKWHILPICAPGSKNSLFSAYNSFVNVGLSKKEKEKKKMQLSKKTIVMTDLLVNIDDLIECDYPIHLETPGITDEYKNALIEKYESSGYQQWVDTIEFEHDGPHTFAIDCEMCMSENGLVLTRCSIVNFDSELIYDKLVKPDVPITDYLTKYSGITKEKLEHITTTLDDVQQDILKIISSKDVLIGHSLQSDLNVLHMRHPLIVDTALIYEHKAGPPFKPALRYLASEYLNIDIQKESGLGHDSYEDAKTCMELTKLKIQNGLAFGIGINTENLFHRLARNGINSMILNDSAPKQTSSLRTETNETKVRCSNDGMVIDNICEHINDHNFFVGRLRELEFARGFTTPHNPNVTVLDEEEAIKNLGNGITKIYESLPPSTMLLICSGTGDTRDWLKIMSDLNSLNKEERSAEKTKREGEIQEAIRRARDAISFLVVKPGKAITNESSEQSSISKVSD